MPDLSTILCILVLLAIFGSLCSVELEAAARALLERWGRR